MRGDAEIGPEVDDAALLDFPAEFLDVVVTNKARAGKTLSELATLEAAHGVFLRKLVRAGEPMPFDRESRGSGPRAPARGPLPRRAKDSAPENSARDKQCSR